MTMTACKKIEMTNFVVKEFKISRYAETMTQSVKQTENKDGGV